MAGMVLLFYVFGAMLMDLRRMRIDNRWIIFGWAAGLIYRLFIGGVSALPGFFLACILPIALFWLLFICGMLGAGDIKLLSVICGVSGVTRGLYCIACAIASGALISCLLLLYHGNALERARYFFGYLQKAVRQRQIEVYRKPGMRAENMHFSVAIFISVLIGVCGVY